MLRLIPLAVASLLVVHTPAAAQAPFEGVVTVDLTTPGLQSMESAVQVKGSRMRSEMSMGGMQAYSIIDAEKGTMVIVMPSQRMYMTQTMAGLAAGANVDPAKAAVASFEATGRKGTFAGIPCEHYLMKLDADFEADACVAKGIGTFLGVGTPGRSNRGMPAGLRDLARNSKDGVFILRMDVTAGPGKGTIMEVKKLEKKPVDNAIFVVPEGFQDMSGMMQNMPGRRPPGPR